MAQGVSERPLKVAAVRLPQELIDAAQRHADLYHTSVSTLLREGLELRLRSPQPPEAAEHQQTVLPATITMLTDIAKRLSTAAAEVHSRCQQLTGTASDGHTHAILPEYDGHTTGFPDRSVAAVPQPEAAVEACTAFSPPPRAQRKLTTLDAVAMLTKQELGVSIKALMEEYHVSKATVQRYLADARNSGSRTCALRIMFRDLCPSGCVACLSRRSVLVRCFPDPLQPCWTAPEHTSVVLFTMIYRCLSSTICGCGHGGTR